MDALARSLADLGLPHTLLVDAARQAIAAGSPESARERAEGMVAASLRPVINATGVLLHTNMGRAPVAIDHPARYTNLELDLATGRRGIRGADTAQHIATLVGAESALVVNNGAAAVLVVLGALAAARRVIVSRGELVEIGGGFRIPDVLTTSGAILSEVGTTNRTHLDDYRRAVGDDVALILKVHQSNYRITGFTAAVDVPELAGIGPPVVFDIGSGLLDAGTPWLAGGPPSWLKGEPAVRQALAQGAALVTFSGDKLMGGPQAGVIAGRADLVAACARHPLFRAMRPGELVLAALHDVVQAYLRRDGDAIPFWRAATRPVEELRRRATALGVGEVVASVGMAGGGSAPGLHIPSAGVALRGDLTPHLRRMPVPVVARVRDGTTIADLRTVEPGQDGALGAALAQAERRFGRTD